MQITKAVAYLLRQSGDADLIADTLQTSWLQCVDNPIFKHQLSRSLGLGEQRSIEYTLQADSKTLLIMDDALARKQAIRLSWHSGCVIYGATQGTDYRCRDINH